MKQDYFSKDYENLKLQRNALAALTFFSSCSLLLSSYMLLSKRERVVVMPASFNQTVWLDQHGVSATYLEQIAEYLAQGLLTKDAASASEKRDLVLHHTSPAFRKLLEKSLKEEEEKLKKEVASYVFFPVGRVVNPDKLEVKIGGNLKVYSGDRELSSKAKKYKLAFDYSGGRLLLREIKELEELG